METTIAAILLTQLRDLTFQLNGNFFFDDEINILPNQYEKTTISVLSEMCLNLPSLSIK